MVPVRAATPADGYTIASSPYPGAARHRLVARPMGHGSEHWFVSGFDAKTGNS